MKTVVPILCVLLLASALPAADDWPQFRGPNGNGHSPVSGLPLKWSEQENVAWKTPIHDRGWSSPVVWGNQVWLTTATQDGSKLYAIAVDRESGKIVHDIHVFDVEHPLFVPPANTYASPTSVIEDGRVYVHFGTNGTACLDSASGAILWTRRDLNCDHEQGAGSSPMLLGNLLVVNVDGRDVQYVVALDKNTGKTVWKTDRSIDYSVFEVFQRKAYSMPIAVPKPDGGNQLISLGAKAMFAYDPATGSELWKVRHDGWSIAPRPVYGHGLVFAIVDHDQPQLWAVRPDGSGDVTDSHVVWKITQAMPARPSLLLIDDLLFIVSSSGIASCLEAKTGSVVWRQRIEGKYSASPIYADGRIYFFNEDARATVIKPARQFEVLAINELATEQLMASPAVAGHAIFVRTAGHLYRIAEPTAK